MGPVRSMPRDPRSNLDPLADPLIDHLYLHIGHFKTGTTSIQSTFRENAALLARHGVFYFAEHRNHHPIARTMHRASWKKSDQRITDEFVAKAKASELPTALVSSETLQRLERKEIENCLQILRTVARRVSVVLYVRHPVALATSAAHQGVRMGRPLAEIERSPRALALKSLITDWREVAGPENLIVRPFARPMLRNGDVIDDLLEVIGASDAAASMARSQVNEALSVLGIHLLERAHRKAGPGTLPYDVVRVFDAIGGPKYVLPAESQEKVRQASVEDLAFLEEEYGIVLPEPTDRPSDPIGLSDEELDSTADVLLTLATHGFESDRTNAARLIGQQTPYFQIGVGPHRLVPLFTRLGIVDWLRATPGKRKKKNSGEPADTAQQGRKAGTRRAEAGKGRKRKGDRRKGEGRKGEPRKGGGRQRTRREDGDSDDH